mmetsp:Transcript_40238/g.89334  ORF Transcript_40238/g.89334 Transcript_40238/m.89334 type:complete len:288 (-) Transcript_40238:715-1578(-)
MACIAKSSFQSGVRHVPVRSGLSRANHGKVVRCSLPVEYTDKLRLGYNKILVAGATGRTGREVVNTLLAQGVSVRALVRDVSKADKLFKSSSDPSDRLEVVAGDVFQYATLPKAFGGADAVIVATGASDPTDPLGPFNIDFQGTLNLLALAKRNKVKKFVLVTSIGTDELVNFLNLFWGVLFWKKRAEEEVQRSGIDYTIVRPGGLLSELRNGAVEGNVVMQGPGYYGVPPARPPAVTAGSILRKQVAEVCVAALVEPSASNKVVEIIAKPDAPALSFKELYEGVRV